MTPELTALALAALLQVGQLCLYSVAGQAQAGTKKALKPRDEPVVLTGKAGRIHRALNNHFEGLILFSIACLVIAVSGQSTGFTAACAFAYLAARIAYIPAYVFGWVPWRSAIWAVGFLATALMLLAALV
ncbi:MAPEG family protein [Roseovarius faecimaris]|uniref:MAPEG family protein n=1 Tax=Roseovarius faecimaris TaxID=2494550 RepID=A0A6I6IN78_9RHOB|nr:MAPEG family protein [Roseovarius faecimaris]QGX97271.1 MAPEG family protein [Roseovarius faecimaris]